MKWSEALKASLIMVVLLCLVMIAEVVFRLPVDRLGIVPRTEQGLVGILFSPLLHTSRGHLTANLVPIFVLMLLLFADRRYFPLRTLAIIWMASGLGTWLIGRGNAVHIGASAVIFGLVTYLVVAGFMMKNWRAAGVAILVFVFFGGIFYGVLPQAGSISWEGHLSGAVAGIWTARRNLRRTGAR